MDDTELSDITSNTYILGDTFKKNSNCLVKTVLVVSLINMCVLLLLLSSAIYVYISQRNNIESLYSEAQSDLQVWRNAYEQLQPYLTQMGELFNFTREATQFIHSAEKCIESYGICNK